jgi:hypothetical protein
MQPPMGGRREGPTEYALRCGRFVAEELKFVLIQDLDYKPA